MPQISPRRNHPGGVNLALSQATNQVAAIEKAPRWLARSLSMTMRRTLRLSNASMLRKLRGKFVRDAQAELWVCEAAAAGEFPPPRE